LHQLLLQAASAKCSTINVHTAAANIKQILGADVNAVHFIDVKMLPANPMHLMFWMACLQQSQCG
jgi:hypothetical protein